MVERVLLRHMKKKKYVSTGFLSIKDQLLHSIEKLVIVRLYKDMHLIPLFECNPKSLEFNNVGWNTSRNKQRPIFC